MGETTEFEKLRRKKRRKKRLHRLLVAMVSLALAAVLLLTAATVYQLDIATPVGNLIASLRSGDGFSVDLGDLQVSALVPMGGDAAVVASTGTYVYNRNGALLYSFPNRYSNPVSRSSSGRLLTFDLGGNDFRVDSETKNLYTGQAPGKIYAGDLAKNGRVAIASAKSGYLACVTVYSQKFEEIYSWSARECYVTAVALSDRGKYFCAAGLTAGTGGEPVSQLRFHTTGSDAETAVVTLGDKLILSLDWTGEDRVQVVTEDTMYLYDAAGRELACTQLPERRDSLVHFSDGGIAVAWGDYRNPSGLTVRSYNEKLEQKGELSLTRPLISLTQSGNHLLILTEGELYLSDLFLSEAKLREQADAVYYLCGNGNRIYSIGPQGLDRGSL